MSENQTTELDPDVSAWRDAYIAANGREPDVLPVYEDGWFTWRHPHGTWLTGRDRRDKLRRMTETLRSRVNV